MVDKRLILAVAGSGKTRLIIENLDLETRAFIVTYTNNNMTLIRKRILTKFGYFPDNIKVFTFFEFLFNFCLKPFCYQKYKIRGIFLDDPPLVTNYLRLNNIKRYKTDNGRFYRNRISKFIEFENITDLIIKRLEKFCDCFCYDETQDLGGHDFEFMLKLSKANIRFLYVGDFFQNTYLTSYDGNTNANLYKDYNAYVRRFSETNIVIDTTTLSKSHRCSPSMCSYISENLGIAIDSHRKDSTEISLVTVPAEIKKILDDNNIMKLVYDKSNLRNFRAKNWGECKGEDDYNNTCIILNKRTYKLYQKKDLNSLASRTKNKLYVALSRTKGNCYLINESTI